MTPALNGSAPAASGVIERYPGRFAVDAPERPAVVFGPSGWTQTYAELDGQANRLATYLRDNGLRPGDHVAILLENHPRYLEILWGCHYAGLIYTTCSTRLKTAELAYIVNDCGATAFITSARFAADAEGLVAVTPGVRLRLSVDGEVAGSERYEPVIDSRAPERESGPRIAGADMLYSSGTTGRPKGIRHEAKARPLETAPVGVSYLGRRLFGFGEDTVYLCPAPLYHGAGLRFAMAVTALGGTVVLVDRFRPDQFLELVERYSVTHTQVVPTMMRRLVGLSREARASHDLSSLRFLLHSAAPTPRDLKRQMIEWLGPRIYEYYAGTESNGVVFCSTPEWLAHPGTVGRAIGCTLHICDDDGLELPAGEIGTVYFEGGASFSYHGDAGKTASSRHPNGWTTLGDIGYLDDDGYLYLTDRKDFVIISGGVNIYPQETENVLLAHPAVRDCAVFGVPDDEFGERVHAVVEPAPVPGFVQSESELAEELTAHCRARLADLKCPRTIDFRHELPRDDNGKLRKHALRNEYLQSARRPI